MSEPWDQDEPDFVEGIDDEEAELGADPDYPIAEYAAPRAVPAKRAARSEPRLESRHEVRRVPLPYRIRVMGPKMAARSPNVSSILITKTNGSQVLLVRKGR